MKSDFDEHSPDSLLVGDVLALRAFRVDVSTQTLGGLSYHQEIVPGVNVAQCAYHLNDEEHQVPQNGCTCGWYAYDEIRHWGFGSNQTEPRRPRPSHVSGIVRLSGRVIVCERGLKAQHLEIIALTAHPQDVALIGRLFPKVELFDDESEMIEAYPLTRLDRRDPAAASSRSLTAKVGEWFTRKGPIATFASTQWRSLTAQATFSEVVRWATVKLALLMVGVAVLYAINDTASNTYPKGSASGFGPLIPLGILVLLAPVVNLWKSILGLLTFLSLLHYGLVNSAPALQSLMTETGITNRQAAVAIIVLYAVPLGLLLLRFVILYSRFRDRTGTVTGRPVRGAVSPSLVRSTFLSYVQHLSDSNHETPRLAW